jgi:hypothetical protein
MTSNPVHPSIGDGTASYTGGPGQQAPPVQSSNQSAEFLLSNYRLGRTLGIGSFGKVGGGLPAQGDPEPRPGPVVVQPMQTVLAGWACRSK